MKEQSGIYTGLGGRLRDALKVLGMTQLEFARRLKFSSQQISNWKRRSFIPAMQLVRVQSFFDQYANSGFPAIDDLRELLEQMRQDGYQALEEKRAKAYGDMAYGSGPYGGKLDDHGNGVKVSRTPNDQGGEDIKVSVDDNVKVSGKIGLTATPTASANAELVKSAEMAEFIKKEREREERRFRMRKMLDERFDYVRRQAALRDRILEEANPFAWRERTATYIEINGRKKHVDYADDRTAICFLNINPLTNVGYQMQIARRVYNLLLAKANNPDILPMMFLVVDRKFHDPETQETGWTSKEQFLNAIAEEDIKDLEMLGIAAHICFGELDAASRVIKILNWAEPPALELLQMAEGVDGLESVYPDDPEFDDGEPWY